MNGRRRLTGGVAQHDGADRPLGHHVTRDDRTLAAVNFQTRAGVGDCEGLVQLRDDAAPEAHDRHRRVLQPCLGHAGALGLGDHVLRLVIEDEAQGIGVVHRDIEDDPAAGFGALDAPRLQVRRQMDGVKHPRRDGRADGAVPHRVADRPVGRGVAQVVIGAHLHPGRRARLDHVARVGQGQRERLLA